GCSTIRLSYHGSGIGSLAPPQRSPRCRDRQQIPIGSDNLPGSGGDADPSTMSRFGRPARMLTRSYSAISPPVQPGAGWRTPVARDVQARVSEDFVNGPAANLNAWFAAGTPQ